MSAISDFAAKQNEFNALMAAGLDGIQTDLAALKALIEQLQNSAGQITPEDQALLDQIQSQTEAMAGRVQEIDAQTP